MITLSMLDKDKVTGQNPGQVFNSRSGCIHAVYLFCNEAKRSNLELKTWPRQLSDALPLYPAPGCKSQTTMNDLKPRKSHCRGRLSSVDLVALNQFR